MRSQKIISLNTQNNSKIATPITNPYETKHNYHQFKLERQTVLGRELIKLQIPIKIEGTAGVKQMVQF